MKVCIYDPMHTFTPFLGVVKEKGWTYVDSPLSDGDRELMHIKFDVVWYEFCTEEFASDTHRLKHMAYTVCRLHSYELFTELPSKPNWDRVGKLLVNSEHIKSMLEGNKRKIDFPPMDILWNGVDFQKFSPEHHGDRGWNKRIAVVGWLNYKKAPELALQVLIPLAADGYTLHFVGQSQDRRFDMYLDDMAKKAGVRDKVHFHGRLPQDALVDLLRQTDIILSTSLFESFGQAILEGVGCGNLAMVHNYSGCEKIFKGIAHLFTSIGDCVESVKIAEEAGEVGRGMVRNTQRRTALKWSDQISNELLRNISRDIEGELGGAVAHPHRAFVITPAYNCKRYIKASVLSVADQDFTNLTHVVVDDCSDDGTWDLLQEDDLNQHDVKMIRNDHNGASALGSFMKGIEYIRDNESPSPMDVVFWVDGDDWIAVDGAITLMMKPYERNSEVEMAYSNNLNWQGGIETGNGYSHPPVDSRTMWRYDRVRYSHLRSFRWMMLDHIDTAKLRDPDSSKFCCTHEPNGTGCPGHSYWKFAGDSALFLQMLEVAKRVKHVTEPLYIYNEEREDNEIKKDKAEQNRCSIQIRHQIPNTNNRPEVWGDASLFAPVRRFKLDHGRACNLSCEFCYYLHEKPWKNKSLEEIESIVRDGASRGNRMCDISGGEPTIAKDLPKWLDICKKYGIGAGIITHGQDVTDKLENLWDHGLMDILFSVHGLKDYHNKVTGTEERDGHSRLYGAMVKCRDSGFKFRTNTVLTQNYEELPHIAKDLVKVRPYISNFINFNPYNAWNEEEKPFQAKVSDIAPYLMAAIDELVVDGTMVNVRYFPFCLLKGYEKHVVNMYQVMFDPYEWDYGVTPKTVEAAAEHGKRLALQTCAFSKKCEECAIAGSVCSGVNKVYLDTFGDGELEPYTEDELDDTKITDPFHFRKHAEPGQLYTNFGHNYEWHLSRTKSADGNKGDAGTNGTP